MRKLSLILVALMLSAAVLAADSPAQWAFLFMEEAQQIQQAPRTGAYSLPGSSRHYTQTEAANTKTPPDWFPDRHPAAPESVVKGGLGMALACGSCHLMSGMGTSDTGSLAGLPASYLLLQLAEFRSGARSSHVIFAGKPVMDSVQFMGVVAKSWPEEDVRPAVEYFSSLKPLPWVKVVEAKTVPKTYVNAQQFMRLPMPGGHEEPLGLRILEVPQDLNRQLLRDPTSGTIAYVPVGSVQRGKELVARGGRLACAKCHGSDLKGQMGVSGQGDVPGIAGRSPVYNYRQLFLYKEGSRGGAHADAMKRVAKTLTDANLIDISAYVATLAP